MNAKTAQTEAMDVAPALQKATNASSELGQVQAGYGKDRDLLNQLLGQAQMAGAFAQFSQTVSISKLAIVKETKLYQQLSGMPSPNGLALKGTWAEFCGLLGMSDEKANQDIANLQAFGEEALDQMQRVGIGYRDLRQFRKLPADQKTALIEAAKAGDKDTLLELAEDMICKHTKEKQELEKRATDAEANLDAADRQIAAKDQKLNTLARKAQKFDLNTDWPQEAAAAIEVVDATGRAIEKSLGLLLQTCSQAMAVFPADGDVDKEQAYTTGAAPLAARVRDTVDRLRKQLDAADEHFRQTLGNFVA